MSKLPSVATSTAANATSTASVHAGDDKREAVRLRPLPYRPDLDIHVREHRGDRRLHARRAARRRSLGARGVRALRQPDGARRRKAARRARRDGGRAPLRERDGRAHRPRSSRSSAPDSTSCYVRDGYRMTRELVEGTLARFGVAADLVPAGDLGRDRARDPARDAPHRDRVADEPVPVVHRSREARRARARRARGEDARGRDVRDPRECRPSRTGSISSSTARRSTSPGTTTSSRGSCAGRAGLVSIVRDLRGVLGSVCDPHAAFLVERGVKTLALRVQRQNATGLAVARFLEGHARVERVFYPGLASHPDHAIALEADERLRRGRELRRAGAGSTRPAASSTG